MTPLETLALVALVAAGFALIFALIVATTRRGADTPPAEDWDDWSRSEPDETDTARRPGRAGLLVLAALVLALPGCASSSPCHEEATRVRIVALTPAGADNWFAGPRPAETTVAFPDGTRDVLVGTFGQVGEEFPLKRKVCR